MFELLCFLAVLSVVVLAIVGWVNAQHWKNRYFETLDECQFLDLKNTQLRQQLYGDPEERRPQPTVCFTKAGSPSNHQCTAAVAAASDGLVESAAIAAATDNAMLGGLVGGNILGGLIGEMLHDSTEPRAVEAAEDLVVDGEAVVRAGDTLELHGDSAAVVGSYDDASSSRDTSHSYSDLSSSSDSGSSYDSGSDSGFSSSDW